MIESKVLRALLNAMMAQCLKSVYVAVVRESANEYILVCEDGR
jgi:hypothetical protein